MATETNKEIQQLLGEAYHQYKNREFVQSNLTYEMALEKLTSAD